MLSSFGNQRRTLPSCTHKSCCCPVGCASLENAPVPRCFPISSHHVFFPESRCRQHKRSGRRRATSRSEPQPRSSCCTEPSPTASSPDHLTPPVCHDSGTQVGDLVPSKSRSSRSRISCRNKKSSPLSLSPSLLVTFHSPPPWCRIRLFRRSRQSEFVAHLLPFGPSLAEAIGSWMPGLVAAAAAGGHLASLSTSKTIDEFLHDATLVRPQTSRHLMIVAHLCVAYLPPLCHVPDAATFEFVSFTHFGR